MRDPVETNTSGSTRSSDEWFSVSGEFLLFLLAMCLGLGAMYSRASTLSPRRVAYEICYWLVWGLMVQPLSHLVRKYPIERPHRFSRTVLYALVGFPVALAHSVVLYLVTWPFLHVHQIPLADFLKTAATFGQFAFWATLGLKHASHYYRLSAKTDAQAARLRAELAQARVDAIRVRIRPASVRARLEDIARRLHVDPESADDAVVRLGTYLRRRLTATAAVGTPGPDPSDIASSPVVTLTPSTGWWNWKAEIGIALMWNAVVLGPLLASQCVFSSGLTGQQALDFGLELGLFASLWVVLCLPVGGLIERYPIERPHRLLRLCGYMLLGVAAGALHCVVHLWAVRLLLAGHQIRYPSSPIGLFALELTIGQASYGVIVFLKHVSSFRRRYTNRLIRAADLRTQLSLAQLGALQMQLHPHFLFNTLHSISELVHEDRAAAQAMLRRLSDFLRLTFESSDTQLVTVERELEFLEHYLGIQRIRFQDRLVTTLDVDPATRGLLLPSLILQPLVENAIKHGVARRVGAGYVRVSCLQKGDDLEIEIRNESAAPAHAPLRTTTPSHGIGLRNTESRLRHLYGRRAQLRLEADDSGGAIARLTIPATLAALALSTFPRPS